MSDCRLLAGIATGMKLTPWMRYARQGAVKKHVASSTLQSDGSFAWASQIKKPKGLTACMFYSDVESGRVFWARVTRSSVAAVAPVSIPDPAGSGSASTGAGSGKKRQRPLSTR